MRSDPVAPGIPPLALHCIDVFNKEEFLDHLAGQYSYKILGSMHTVAARKELLEELRSSFFRHLDSTHTRTLIVLHCAGHPIYSMCLAFIYCGLDDQECLRLSARHNINGHFNHKSRHRDYMSTHTKIMHTIAKRECAHTHTNTHTHTQRVHIHTYIRIHLCIHKSTQNVHTYKHTHA